MPQSQPFRVFTRKFEGLQLRYAVTGSLAAIYYGEPRMTNDVDIVCLMRREDAARLHQAFPQEEFYCPPPEVIEMELAREQRGHFNLIHHETGFKADIYLVGRDELHHWALKHSRAAQLDGDTIRFAPPEYIIVRKLQFYREGGSEKHLRDIDRMLEGLGDEWPRTTLEGFIRDRGLASEWAKVLASRGPGTRVIGTAFPPVSKTVFPNRPLSRLGRPPRRPRPSSTRSGN